MRQRYIYFGSIFLLVMGLTMSCDKKNPSPGPTTTPVMKATISGAAWAASTIKYSGSNGVDTITGYQASDSSTVMLLLSATQLAGGDTFRINSINTLYYFPKRDIYYGWSGFVSIYSYSNNYFSGTFQASIEDNFSNKLNITGGVFTVKQ